MTSNKTEIKFGFYRITPEVIASLKEINDTVCDCVYIGPLMTIDSKRGPVPLFAPMNADLADDETVMHALKNGRYENIDFYSMIPITSKQHLIDANNEIPDDKKSFILASREALEKLAQGAYARQ